MQVRSEVKAGIVILISLFLFGGVLVSVGKFGEIFKKKQKVVVLFSDVQGLKVDDPVQFMGLERGRVDSIEVSHYQDEAGFTLPAIEVTAQLTYADALPADSKITVDRSLTGNTALKIEPGRSKDVLASGQKFMGLGAVSMTEIASKAGVMAKRLDEFLSDLTSRDMSGSIRAVISNLKQVSMDAKLVTSSLGQSIPSTEKNLVSAMKNIADVAKTVDDVVAGNKDKLNGMVKSLASTTASIAKASNNLDLILEKNRDKIGGSLAHVEKATSNLKALTREVRWQPWVLLNKPDEVEIKERSVYNSALEFSEGAETLNNTVKELLQYVNNKDGSKDNQKKYAEILSKIHENLEKSEALERKLWVSLTDKANGKTKDH